MTTLSKIAITIAILFVAYTATSQSNDVKMAHKYFNLFQNWEYENARLAKKYVDSGMYFALRTKDNQIIGKGHMFMGWLYQDESKFKEANLEFYKSLAYLKKAGDRQGVADAYGNLGNSYFDLHEYQKSLDYQLLSVDENDKIIRSKVSEEEKQTARLGRTYAMHNIGAIYAEIGVFDKALQYEWGSLNDEISYGNLEGIAISYNTLGSMYKEMKKLDSAEYYYKKAITLFESDELDADFSYASALQGYASMEKSSLSPEKKRQMVLKALQIRREVGDVDGEVQTLLEIAESEFKSLSKDSLSKLLELSYKLLTEYELEHQSELYFKLYSKYASRIGKFDEAYFALENYLELKAVSDEKRRTYDLIAGDIRHQLNSKYFNDSLKIEKSFAEERADYNEELTKIQNVVYLSVIGFIILIVTLFVIINTNRRRKRMNEVLSQKNELIQEQKEIVEEKNKSISDSINYARRLQTAILPTTEQVNKYFPDSFLFFKPKDIVSGDFYWFEASGDVAFMAAADCTGHGVPGAMVSVVCSNALNRSVNEFGLTRPNEILDKTRDIVIETLGKSGEDVADGMDIALVAINRKKGTIQFSGAQNPMWIVRKIEDVGELEEFVSERTKTHALLEFKGDKQPIGLYTNMTDFSVSELKFKEGDTIYLSSDGYADQFGGDDGKKYKYRPLKLNILSIQALSMDAQKVELVDNFDKWIGDYEQIDDICVIGFKL